MASYSVHYPFSPWYGGSKRELVAAAERYFGQRNYYVRASGRTPDNMDIHTWVYMFIANCVRSGEIPQPALTEDIARLTELLWDVAVLQMMKSGDVDDDLLQ